MSLRSGLVMVFVGLVALSATFLVAFFYLPWSQVNWGSLRWLPERSVSVVGYGESKEKNEVAHFTAGFSLTRDNKDEAVNEVNLKIGEVIESVKSFGVKEEDLKTESLNVYQRQETYYEENRQKTRPGQWEVSSSISITLRDASRASALSNLLAKTGATNVYGPNFNVEDTKDIEGRLTEEALKDAFKKAEAITASRGLKLGRVLNISEGTTPVNAYNYGGSGRGGGGGPSVEVGGSQLRKAMSVTFALE